MNYQEKSVEVHEALGGKLAVQSKISITDKEALSIAYTPGVAGPCKAIADDVRRAHDLTIKGNTVAVISDGSAVLGLGNIGPEAAMPVMEGKSALFKEFAGVDAFPMCLATQDTEEIIRTVELLAPGFGGVNLEDISAPRCFVIEDRLQDLGIPVFHDDQHGTAIVILAALLNAAKVVDKPITTLKVVISGAGAAGTATAKLLSCMWKVKETGTCVGVHNIVVCDSKGIIGNHRDDLNETKQIIAGLTNKENREGSLAEALVDADVFIGVSVAGALKQEMIQTMASKPIVIAMANPVPEIMPDEAKAAGAVVVATGRSDFPNQVNNVLAFPGIFKGALQIRASRITEEMKLAAAKTLASLIEHPTADCVLPDPLTPGVADAVADAVAQAWNT